MGKIVKIGFAGVLAGGRRKRFASGMERILSADGYNLCTYVYCINRCVSISGNGGILWSLADVELRRCAMQLKFNIKRIRQNLHSERLSAIDFFRSFGLTFLEIT